MTECASSHTGASPAATRRSHAGRQDRPRARSRALRRSGRGALRAWRSRSSSRWRPASCCSSTPARRSGAREPAHCRESARVKFVDEFRDAELGRALAGEILAAVEPGRHYKIMEVCGGHTHSIYKYGIDDLLPAKVELVHGPGCPVCVIPMGRVDDGIALAHEPGVIFTCFGDMVRVPGSSQTCSTRRPRGPMCGSSTRRSTPCGSPSRTPTARSCSSRSASRPPRPRPR